MQTFFDAMCSSWLIAIPIMIVIFLAMCALLFKIKVGSGKLNSFLWVLCLLAIPGLFYAFCYVAGSVYGFGYASKFEANLNNSKYLCYITEGTFKMHTRGGYSDMDCRLNVVDPQTGKRISRRVIGYFSSAISLKGDTLLFKVGGSSYTLYDVNKGMEIARFDPDSLPVMFKEFSSGVEVIKYDEYSGFFKATAKDGNTYYIEPYSMQLTTSKIKKDYTPKKNQLNFDNYEMDLDNVRTVKLTGQNSDDKLVKLYSKKDHLLNENLTFIYGTFLYNLPDTKQFLVLSYETTDKSNFIINCISSEDFTLKWQLKQNVLDANDFFTRDNVTYTRRYNYTATMEYPDVVGQNFVFAIQGFVFGVDLTSGKLNWKTRL